MANEILNRRTVIALILGALIIIGAYWYTGHTSSIASANIAQASETDKLLAAVAAKDTDGDGLPDWEEVLYGTNPDNPHSVSPTLTDKQAVDEGLVKPKFSSDTATAGVMDAGGATSATASANASSTDLSSQVPGIAPDPGSLTDQFAKAFFTQYMQANQGQPPSEDQQQQLITGLTQAFEQNTLNLVETHYATSTAKIDDTVSDMDYIKSLEAVLIKNDLPASDANLPKLLQAAVENNDLTALPKLHTLATTYATDASDISQLPVPSTLVSDHLALMRAFDLLGQATALAANFQHDPLAGLAGASVYKTAPGQFTNAILDLENVIVSNVGKPSSGAPGYVIWVMGEHAKAMAAGTSSSTPGS